MEEQVAEETADEGPDDSQQDRHRDGQVLPERPVSHRLATSDDRPLPRGRLLCEQDGRMAQNALPDLAIGQFIESDLAELVVLQRCCWV